MRLAQPARRPLLIAVFAVVALALFAASAAAATFTVDSIGTGSDLSVNGTCDTDATSDVDCTLRAAIEEANGTSGGDTIVFRSTQSPSDPDDVSFDLAGNRVIGGTLPTITHPLNINGGDCLPAPDVPANPCVRLSTGIVVDSDGEVAIAGLAFSDATTAIHVVHVAGANANPDFQLGGSWFGFDVAGAKQAPPGTAVLLEDVDGAQIGGSTREQRNLFARQGTGIDILGADDTDILGNWFGLAPDGGFARTGEGAAANGDAIEVSGVATPADQATGTQIGLASSGTSAAPTCDDFCNSIVGAGRTGAGAAASGTAIDLNGEPGDGEIPAQGAVIVGNVVGTDALPNSGGINVGSAKDVTIGGAGLPARNLIGPNPIGSDAGATGLSIRNNQIGTAASTASPVVVNGSGEVIGNFVASGTAAAAIQLVNTPAPGFVVQGNVIGEDADGNAVSSGRNGILVNNGATGNTIGGSGSGEGNVVSNLHSTAPPTFNSGIVIAGDGNEVVGNTVGAQTDGTPSALVNGILLTGDADDNVVGGATADSENEIVNTAQGVATTPAAAIRVTNQSVAVTSSGNQILRNHGSGNEDMFIDLGDDGPGNVAGGPNGGVLAPAIATAFPTQAAGTAAPGATVRVFAKSDAAAGELAGFVAEATANGSGSWTVFLPSSAIGQRLTATQTTATGTSELAPVVQVTDEPPPPDTTPPDTAITTKPKDRIKLKRKKKTAKATYAFTATEAGSTFTCQLDSNPAAPCSSPLKLTKLKKGKHTFSAFATDAAGNADASAATDTFRIKKKRKHRHR